MSQIIPDMSSAESTPVREGAHAPAPAHAPASPHEKPLAEKDAGYFNLTKEIPSNLFFYPFDSLSIKTFDVSCLRKLNLAKQLGKRRPVMETISATIDSDINAEILTEGDFWALMLWQRINSYKKFKFTLTSFCDDEEHQAAVKDKKLDATTLYSTHTISSINNIELIAITEERKKEISEFSKMFYEKYGVYLYPATIGDFVEHEEIRETLVETDAEGNEKILDKDAYEDFLYTAQYAGYFNRTHGYTLKERIDFFNISNFPVSFVEDFKGWDQLVDHGIKETVTVACQECGAKKDIELSFDVLSFFP